MLVLAFGRNGVELTTSSNYLYDCYEIFWLISLPTKEK